MIVGSRDRRDDLEWHPMDEQPFGIPPELFGKVPLFAEIAKAMSWSGGPVNWDLAAQIANAMAGEQPVVPVIDEDRAELAEAARLTESWLLDATGLPAPSSPVSILTLSPSEWVARGLRQYPELVDPLAAKIASAGDSADLPAEEAAVGTMLKQVGPLLLGIQTGTLIGSLATSLLTGYDLPLPLEDGGALPLLVGHIDAHALSYGIDRREVRWWMTLHAVAHRVLYEGIPEARAQFFARYHEFLSSIDLNIADLLERLQGMDMSDPAQLRSAVGEGLFGFGDGGIGPARDGLQRFVALIEATAGLAAEAAAKGRLVEAPRVAESLSRRRAEGSADVLLARFTGLDAPPEVTRQARAFCSYVTSAAGWSALSTMWQDEVRMPTGAELADPESWIVRTT